MFSENIELLRDYQELVEKQNKSLLEGLITTRSIEATVDLIKRWFSRSLYIQRIEIVDGKIYIGFSKSLTENGIEKLMQLTNNMGYYPSALVVKGSKDELKFVEKDFYENLKNVYVIIFEAKYDLEINIDSNTNLYHVTTKEKLPKILKIGLVPKSYGKISNHPERIYFTKERRFAEVLKDDFSKRFPENEYVILKINPLKNRGKTITFYNDPNFDEFGIYTYWNIHPNMIEEIL